MTLPASFQRLLPIAAAAVAALAAVLLVARGLGGGSTASAQQVLDRAIKEQPRSGELNVHVTFALENGGKATTLVDRVVTGARAATAPGAPPRQRLHFSERIAGNDPVSFDVLSTGEQGYLRVDGRWHQLSDAQFKRVFTAGKGASLVEALGFDPRRWIREPKLEATARVGGLAVDHVSGAVDADAALTGLGLYEGATTPQARRAAAAIKGAAKHGSIDVFAGKEDGILRKVSVTAQTDPAKGSQVRSTLSFTMALDKVNQPVKVDAPKSALAPSSIATISRSKLGDEAGEILAAPSKPSKSPGTGTARRHHKKSPAKAPPSTGRHPKRSQKAYVSCVQGAENLAALERCQALLP